jgi:hypothetical protein
MKKSSKAALLSGLVFPGVGHLVLKQYFRGYALVLSALVALWVIATRILQQAQTIVDRINSGDMPLDSGAIAEIVSNSTGRADSLVESIAVIVLGACWLFGIIDSYRIGVSQEK